MSLFDCLPRVVRLREGPGVVRCVHAADGSRVRVLEVGGVYQSATYLDGRRMEPAFSYYRAFDRAFSVRPETRRVLMVGGGGYAWPKHVLATRGPEVVLDVVELDPAVTRAARRWFFVDEAMARWPGRLRLIEGDGREFLEGRALRIAAGEDGCDAAGRDAVGSAMLDGTEPEDPADGLAVQRVQANGATAGRGDTAGLCYDAIVLDAFAGAEPVRALATVEAARAARSCLVPDGLVLANVVSEDAGACVDFLRDVVATFSEVFAHVHVLACDEEPFAVEDNYLLIATDGAWPVPDAIPYDDDFAGEVLRDWREAASTPLPPCPRSAMRGRR